MAEGSDASTFEQDTGITRAPDYGAIHLKQGGLPTMMKFLVTLFLTSLLFTCGGGGGGSDTDGSGDNSNWDQLVWDKDHWK